VPLAHDKNGNELTAVFPPTAAPGTAPTATTPTPTAMSAAVPMPAALAAVWHDRYLLLVFDRHRNNWELPGGRIDPGETPHDAAVRELHEESGLRLPALTLAGYGLFHLTHPPRDEYLALYTGRAPTLHTAFTPNEEISAIHWWDTARPPPPGTQLLDTTLALTLT
jgi:8-oxo-dGTP diphosphatase